MEITKVVVLLMRRTLYLVDFCVVEASLSEEDISLKEGMIHFPFSIQKAADLDVFDTAQRALEGVTGFDLSQVDLLKVAPGKIRIDGINVVYLPAKLKEGVVSQNDFVFWRKIPELWFVFSAPDTVPILEDFVKSKSRVV